MAEEIIKDLEELLELCNLKVKGDMSGIVRDQKIISKYLSILSPETKNQLLGLLQDSETEQNFIDSIIKINYQQDPKFREIEQRLKEQIAKKIMPFLSIPFDYPKSKLDTIGSKILEGVGYDNNGRNKLDVNHSQSRFDSKIFRNHLMNKDLSRPYGNCLAYY